MTKLLVLLALLCVHSVQARLFSGVYDSVLSSWGQAPADQAALHARELVHRNIWSTLSTNSVQFPGTPMGHTVSYSDGIGKSAANATGELFFYLTTLDPAGQNLQRDARASVTITLAQEGEHACKMDVENPTCWKLTLIGRVVPITDEAKLKFALHALFSKHPEMATWPRDHGFLAYVLQVDTMLLLDFYGGAKTISPESYYSVKLSDDAY